MALAKARLERGAEAEALEAVESHENHFAAAGIAARVRLARAGIAADAFAALDRGDRETALDALLEGLERSENHSRDDLRRAIVGILSEDPAWPEAKSYRRRLAAALG